MSSNEDLQSYEIRNIDVPDEDGDDVDTGEDELLMSDDEPTLADDDEVREVSGRFSNNDRQIIFPPAMTESSNESTAKKQTLKRNFGIASSQAGDVVTNTLQPMPTEELIRLYEAELKDEYELQQLWIAIGMGDGAGAGAASSLSSL